MFGGKWDDLAAAALQWSLTPDSRLAHVVPPARTPCRHQRRQLVRLLAPDGSTAWVGAKELAANCSCMLLHHSPAAAPFARLLRRGDAGRAPQEHVLRVTCREPLALLCGLAMGPQLPPPAPAAARPRKVAVVCGPEGSGRAALARRLLSDFADKLAAAPRLTARQPHAREARQPPAGAAPAEAADGQPAAAAPGAAPPIGAGAPGSEFLRFVSDRDLRMLERSGGLAEGGPHLGAACGTPLWGLEAAWAEGKVALVVGPLSAAEGLKQMPGVEVRGWLC